MGSVKIAKNNDESPHHCRIGFPINTDTPPHDRLEITFQILALRIAVSSLVLAGLVSLFWLTRSAGEELEVGQVYLRAGLPDSAMVTEILTTAPNEAGYLMVTILAYDRLVRIDQVNKCAEIRQKYDAALDIIPIPVHLPDHTLSEPRSKGAGVFCFYGAFFRDCQVRPYPPV